MKMIDKSGIIICIGLGLLLFNQSRYTIDNATQAVITQFGKVFASRTEPGTYYKIPFIHTVHYYNKGVLTAESSQPIPSLDHPYLTLKNRVSWKISDPVKFFTSVFAYEPGRRIVLEMVGSAQRRVIAAHPMKDIVQDRFQTVMADEPLASAISNKIKSMAQSHLLKFGIELTGIEATVTGPVSEK